MSNDLKRIPLKYCRDKAKTMYAYRLKDSDSRCEICTIENSKENPLEAHHYHTMSSMYAQWIKDTGESIPEDVDTIMEQRDRFIEDYRDQITNPSEIAILCRACHTNSSGAVKYRNEKLDIKFAKALHSVYGKTPSLASAPKQKRWVDKMRSKLAAKYPALNIT